MSEQQYQEYLQRFEEALGPVEVGGFAKYKGRLIQKLSLHEFEALEHDYHELIDTYQKALERGDTLNDVVVRILREHAAKLLRKDPVEL